VSTALPNIESEPKGSGEDVRWALARRVAASSTFARSEQLPKLLLYVCRMTVADRVHEINEQRIGVEVFGRAPNYDPAVDGIVRSHATRLRHRLELYFSGEGLQEPLRIEIPRGGYVPRFYAAQREMPIVSEAPVPVEKTVDLPVLELAIPALASTSPVRGGWFRHKWIKPFLAGFSLAAVVVVVAYHLRQDAAAAAAYPGIRQTEIERKFWNTLFPANGRTIIVPGDSGLVLYETLTGHEVTLADYIGGVYRDPYRAKTDPAVAAQPLALNVASRRYTSIVDLDLAAQLSRLPEWSPQRAATIFARDLRASDADGSNLIILGSQEANPWVSLAEPSMNFVLTSDKKWGFRFLNRHPASGELENYVPQEPSGGIGAPAVYGDVAYLPNPSGKGMVLVLSGLWMSGTQSAGDFVLNGSLFSAWLRSIASPDGTIPPFELLIATSSLDSSATNSSIIAKRVHART
jgi:hypothetical protein